MHLAEINAQYQTFKTKILNDDELLVVQHWINRVVGNRNISRLQRKAINDEALDFSEIVEFYRLNAKLRDEIMTR